MTLDSLRPTESVTRQNSSGLRGRSGWSERLVRTIPTLLFIPLSFIMLKGRERIVEQKVNPVEGKIKVSFTR